MCSAWPLRFGLRFAQFDGTYQETLRCWQEAEALGFDTAWLSDHVVGVSGSRPGQDARSSTTRCDEAWTLLSALLAKTERIRGGIMVSANTFRHPALVAHMARTVDHLSDGRLEFGFGAGWTEDEHAMFGWELPPAPERIRWFDEACELIKRLWTEPEVTFTGTKYQLTRAVLEPKPVQRPYPHFVIGASGTQLMLRVTARHADEWNARIRDPETYRAQVEALARHCHALGRDPATIERSVGIRPGWRSGPAREVAATVNEYVKLGANHLIFQLSPPFTPEQVGWLWRELVPAIRDLAGR